MADAVENDDDGKPWMESYLERHAWEIMLSAAQTGASVGSPGITEARRRFWLQWLQGEGLLTCPECGEEFATPEEYAEHEKWEC